MSTVAKEVRENKKLKYQIRYRNRCRCAAGLTVICANSVCAVVFREYAMKGEIPGIRKLVGKHHDLSFERKVGKENMNNNKTKKSKEVKYGITNYRFGDYLIRIKNLARWAKRNIGGFNQSNIGCCHGLKNAGFWTALT